MENETRTEETSPGVRKRTKIVCTIGPSSLDEKTLARMAEAGMDVVRINSAHSSAEQIVSIMGKVKRVGNIVRRRIGAMLDLQGPRLRVGPIKGSEVEVRAGQELSIFAGEKLGDEKSFSLPYANLPAELEPGDAVLIGDGQIRLEVISARGEEILTKVVEGGILRQGKGVNIPGRLRGLPAFTKRDEKHLAVGLDVGVHWISQSFVRDATDVVRLKEKIAEVGKSVPVVAKIEKGEAVERIDEILEVSDGIMVARGDLGVEIPPEDVPLAQKRLIAKCVRWGKPVITATQMLESMVDSPVPTRAETSDVANAVLDGSDAIMLSAETAIGRYPVEAVEMMKRVAVRAEGTIDYGKLLEEGGKRACRSAADSIAYAACKIASDLDIPTIISISRSGYTARMIASYRPKANLLVASPSEEVVNQALLFWDTLGFVVPPIQRDFDETIKDIIKTCLEKEFLRRDQLVVITGGFLGEEVGTTNLVHVRRAD
ncbi:MAG: pyruvate kinase [Actinomycetota bacterium]|nr:pyruvate kinase [Actinomycetota bacterium]